MAAVSARPASRPSAHLIDKVADRWVRSLGLDTAFTRSGGFRAREVSQDTIRLEWVALERMAGYRQVSAEVSLESGMITVDRPFSHWSDLPSARSRVLIVPDILTFIALSKAINSESVFPFVMVTPVTGLRTPPEWLDLRYWDFKSVTVLSDKLSNPMPVFNFLANQGLKNLGIMSPTGAATWRSWALGRRVRYSDFAAVEGMALPACAFTPTAIEDVSTLGQLRRGLRTLDGEGRLCRLVSGWRSSSGLTREDQIATVRSDRTYSAIAARPRRLINRFAPPQVRDADGHWALHSIATFLDDGAAPTSPEIGRQLLDLILPFVSGELAAARSLAAYVALTYVFPGIGELPLLVVHGGGPSERLALRRLLANVLFQPTVVARNRALQLARIADAGSGVLVLEEPGPVCGPSGPTELGRFLESSLVRDASSYTTVTTRYGLRKLDVFGPKIVISANEIAAGLACSAEIVQMPQGVSSATISKSHNDSVRDALHVWSMRSFKALQSACVDKHAGEMMRIVAQELFGSVPMPPLDTATTSQAPTPAPQPRQRAPNEVMDDVMAACGSNGYLSMVQVMLEIALRGANGPHLSPERVGRWVTTHASIDASRLIERRRLYGQISRIYPLESCSHERRDITAAFEFCTNRVCGECRYDSVCATTFPGMQDRKSAF